MLGVYIQFIDFDDFAGSCGCKNDINGDTKFPATTAIVFGMEKNITKIAFCGNFGEKWLQEDRATDDKKLYKY